MSSTMMHAVDLIRKKRDGGSLEPEEIAWLIAGLGSGEVPRYQWSSLLMAINWRGMSTAETVALTRAMMNSGLVVDLGDITGPKVDKHSTGGVGDKTSMIVAPIAAACGVSVPMVSGRGLGHTGGTLDKLESIPGFRVNLTLDEYRSVLRVCGLVLIGQTAEIAPADKTLYALRNATATVESIPLIAASILSKKLAEGIDGLVLDVKTGQGAFMESEQNARQLAEVMCAIGREMGKRVVALITRMDQPLGRAIGNAVEVAECIECLKGGGPTDLVDLSIELAAEMLVLGDLCQTREQARLHCRQALDDGAALDRFRRVIIAQGGDPGVIEHPERLPTARHRNELTAMRGGFIRRIDARTVGHATMRLGAGRTRVESPINHAVGLILLKKVGDAVAPGEPIGILHTDDLGTGHEHETRRIEQAIEIGDHPPAPMDLIVDRT